MLTKVEDGLLIVSAAVIFILMVLTMADVIGRDLFLQPFEGNVEFSEAMLLVIVAVAIAGTQRVGGHIGVDALLNRFKEMRYPLYPVLQTFVLLLSEVIFLLAFFYTIRAFLESLGINEKTCGPVYIIFWPFRGVLSFGLLLMCVRLAIQLVQAIRSIHKWGRVK